MTIQEEILNNHTNGNLNDAFNQINKEIKEGNNIFTKILGEIKEFSLTPHEDFTVIVIQYHNWLIYKDKY